MNQPSLGKLILAFFAFFIVVLIAIGAPIDRPPPRQPDLRSPPPGPATASGPGLTLASIDVTLPEDEQTYPDGPGADVINANCTSCHSASMALYQPPLSRQQWHEEVEKMRNTFKAPIAEADVPAIVDYLTAISAKQAPATAEATAPAAPAG